METAKLIDEDTEEIEDDDAHLSIYRHCADYLLSQTDTQTCALFVGVDDECRIPMVSHYVNTPSPSGTSDGNFELNHVGMFPKSDLLKRKTMEWKEIIKKHLIVDEKEKEGDDVEKENKNVEAEEDDVAEAAEPIDL
ncbi:hypothetical protein Hanom_Chr08g00740691 [Helianthus anomalus]